MIRWLFIVRENSKIFGILYFRLIVLDLVIVNVFYQIVLLIELEQIYMHTFLFQWK